MADSDVKAVPSFRLADGAEIPAIGLGTWGITGEAAAEATSDAIRLGYRLIDTALDYENQGHVGEGLRGCGVARDDVFLTSKVEEDEDTHGATRDRLDQLGADWLDLCLLHRPPESGAGVELWEGLIRAREEGLTRQIGVSNYSRSGIDRLIEATGVAPAVNQLEWSPFGHSIDVLEHSRERGVFVQAYSPLTRGERLGDETLAAIAQRHDRSPAQVMLRWSLQLGVPAVPKAARPEHREENIDVFGFELGDDDMKRLGDLNEHYSALAGLPYL